MLAPLEQNNWSHSHAHIPQSDKVFVTTCHMQTPSDHQHYSQGIYCFQMSEQKIMSSFICQDYAAASFAVALFRCTMVAIPLLYWLHLHSWREFSCTPYAVGVPLLTQLRGLSLAETSMSDKVSFSPMSTLHDVIGQMCPCSVLRSAPQDVQAYNLQKALVKDVAGAHTNNPLSSSRACQFMLSCRDMNGFPPHCSLSQYFPHPVCDQP